MTLQSPEGERVEAMASVQPIEDPTGRKSDEGFGTEQQAINHIQKGIDATIHLGTIIATIPSFQTQDSKE